MAIKFKSFLKIFYVLILSMIMTNVYNQQDFPKYPTTDNLINLFYEKYKQAKYFDLKSFLTYFEEYNHNEIYQLFSNENSLTQYYYENNPPSGYKISFPDTSYVFFKIIIDPCKNYKQFCCEGLSLCEQDNKEIKAGGDLEVAWSTNNLIPICENEFNNYSCGLFIEIHMPGNPKIINQIKIDKYYVNGFSTIFISTKNLCSGRYEFWIVSRMRGGNYLNYVKSFFVKYPSCSCNYINELGYNCN